jgi:hypothetical protein
LPDHDKIEPQWSPPEESAAPPASPSPSAKGRKAKKSKRAPEPPPLPQEPSFNVSSSERRSAIASLLAGRAPQSRATHPPPSPEIAITPADAPISSDDAPAAPSAATTAGRWVYLSDAQAHRHPLFGIGGWLIAIAFLIVAGIARAAIEMADFWATTDHGGLAAWIMAVLRSGMALWSALIFGLLIGRSRAFPANFAAYSMLNIIYLVLFGLAFAHVTNNQVFIGVGAAAAVTSIALAYVQLSARVNVTFRRRVRAKRVRGGAAAAPVAPSA